MAPSDEVRSAVGERPSAADQLEQKRRELADAEQALAAAELAMDVQRVVALQHEVAVIRRFIERLSATVAVEAAAAAREEAAALDAALRATYAKKLAALTPTIEAARLAIKAMTDDIRKCSRCWNAAMRAEFAQRLLHMRFPDLDGDPLDALPMSPVAALAAAFAEEVDKFDGESRKATLPVALIVASDTPDQVRAKEMAAAADFVASGADPTLSKDLVALFAAAGPVSASASARGPAPSGDDGAFIGKPAIPIPAGAYQTAVAPSSLWADETPAQKAEREETRRRNTRKQAEVGRGLADAARAAIAEREALQGPLKGRPLKGR